MRLELVHPVVGTSGWYDTSVEEMKAFIGMLIIVGISKLHTLEMYWSSNNSELVPPPLPLPLIRGVMPSTGLGSD